MLTLRYNEPVFILMLRGRVGCLTANNDRLRSWFKLKERSARDWKVRSTKVDVGDFKPELLNRLRSTMAVNVLTGARWNQCRCTAKNSWWWAERLSETCRVVIPIKLEFSASVGFIHTEFVTMHGHTIIKFTCASLGQYCTSAFTQTPDAPLQTPSLLTCFSTQIG